nr:immunoglobulin heavy chain junction region [Mus musculus]MBK4186410.1 immunoglobulin heavy chain junction region [Mus musculus]
CARSYCGYPYYYDYW